MSKDYHVISLMVLCRALTHLTGFVIRTKGHGCTIGYVAHCDPQGKLPPWLVNKVTHSLGPKMVKDLRKAAIGYIAWKSKQLIRTKPWRFPEEGSSPRISLDNVCNYEYPHCACVLYFCKYVNGLLVSLNEIFSLI